MEGRSRALRRRCLRDCASASVADVDSRVFPAKVSEPVRARDRDRVLLASNAAIDALASPTVSSSGLVVLFVGVLVVTVAWAAFVVGSVMIRNYQ